MVAPDGLEPLDCVHEAPKNTVRHHPDTFLYRDTCSRSTAKIHFLHDARAAIGALVSGARRQSRYPFAQLVLGRFERLGFRWAQSAGVGIGATAPCSRDAP